jgi:cell division septation protein DedD
MNENTNTSAGPSGSLAIGKWIGLVVAAVVLAEGIWGILVSLTRSVLLPLLARGMGGDPQSPLYLGKGDFNVPDIFSALIELCLAGILFLLIKMWAAKGAPRARTVRASAAPVKTEAPRVTAQVASVPASPPPPAIPAPISKPVTQAAPPSKPPSPPPAPVVKPAAPKKPKEVYYNIVGEPIDPDE